MTTGDPRRGLPLLALAALLSGTAHGDDRGRLNLPDAVLLNLTQHDLARVVDLALRDETDRLHGHRYRSSGGVTDLRYDLLFSDPALRLGEAGDVFIDVSILEGSLRIGRLERRFFARRAFCEELGVNVLRQQPVNLSFAVRFAVDGGDLAIEPHSAAVDGAGFQLVRPARCGNTFVPTWLIWKLGKSRLKRYVSDLDALVLDRLRNRAARLREGDGFLDKRWRGLRLHPREVDTAGGSLLVRFAASRQAEEPSEEQHASGACPVPRTERSFLAISETLANEVLAVAFGRLSGDHRPRGDVRELLHSEAVDALIPGLDRLDPATPVHASFRFSEPPRVEFTTLERVAAVVPDGRHGREAVIRLHFGGIEMRLVQPCGTSSEHETLGVSREPPRDPRTRRVRTPTNLCEAVASDAAAGGASLGSLVVEAATIGVLPYRGPLGGVSFELVENDWRLGSEGVEFDEEMAAALLREVVFGEAFETRYEPLSTDGLHIGRAAFAAQRFELAGDYLVVGLTTEETPSAPGAAPAVSSVSQANK